MDPHGALQQPPDRFELGAQLGRGAVGVVHRAWDRVLGREVAVKLLLVDRPTATQLERFRREGELARAVDHPNVVRLLATGTCQGRPCLAFELVEGARTLRAGLPELAPRRRIELLRDAARALGAAHAHAIVHRDVKLDNLLLDPEGRIKVTDFGVATATHLARLTRSGAIVGTPEALAPEQVQGGGQVSPATDVWALGVALHEVLLGEPPFQGEDMVTLLARIADAPLRPLLELDPGLDPELAAIVTRCLEKEPSRRWSDGEALACALDGWLAGVKTGTRRAPRPGRGRSRAALLASLVLVSLGVVAALLVLRGARAAHAEGSAALASAVWAQLGSGASVASAATQVAAWEERLRALEARGEADELARAREGVLVARGLVALIAGDPAPARESAERLTEGPARDALLGTAQALDPAGDPREAWERLSRALASGLEPVELRALRARALLKLPEPGPERLAAALSDLALLRLDREGLLLRSELALRAGELELARTCLDDLDAPPELSWRVFLAHAWRPEGFEPLLQDPLRLSRELDRLDFGVRLEGPREQAALGILRDGAAARLRLVRHERKEGAGIDVAHRARLLVLARAVHSLGGALTREDQQAVWDLAIADPGPALLDHLELLRGARELCPPEVVEDWWALAVDWLATLALPVDDAVLEAMVDRVSEPWLRARVTFLRALKRLGRGQAESALEDLRAVEPWLDHVGLLRLWEARRPEGSARVEVEFALARARELQGAPEQAALHALRALGGAQLPQHHVGETLTFDAEAATDLVWRTSFPGNLARVRSTLEDRLARGADRAVLWVRLARVELQDGQPGLAAVRLDAAAAEAQRRGATAEAALVAARAAIAGSASDADARLAALETALGP